MIDGKLATPWTRSLRRGERPDAARLRAHLLTLHRQNAGFTETIARRCRDPQGRNSYEWLSDLVDPARHGAVLDLACGSGPLLDLLRRRHRRRLELIGVDMSADELTLARARLDDPRVRLHQGMAQRMAFLSDASVDAVLCHWALTLMDPVAPVLGEAGRILRPGGVFAAIVDGDSAAAPGYSEIHDLIYAEVRQEYPTFGEVDLGDPQVRDAGRLATLCEAAFPRASVTVDPGVFSLEGPPERLAEAAAGFFYAAFLTPEAERPRLLAAIAEVIAAHGRRFALPVNRLVVRV